MEPKDNITEIDGIEYVKMSYDDLLELKRSRHENFSEADDDFCSYFVIPPKPEWDGHTPISFDEIEAYLRWLRDDNPDAGFMPMRVFSAIIDNEAYDPEGFSQEIEDSEKDMRDECLEFRRKYFDMFWGWCDAERAKEYDSLVNSKRWTDNHSKKCPLTTAFNIVGICGARETKVREKGFIDPDERTRYICERSWRDYTVNAQVLKEWYDGITAKGLKVYRIV